MSEQTQIQQQEPDQPTQSYISRVRLKGYKSIIDTEVTFKPGLNIIIGANGSGKTNFVEYLKFLFFERKSITSLKYSVEVDFFYRSKLFNYTREGITMRQPETNRIIPLIKEKLIGSKLTILQSNNYSGHSEAESRLEWIAMTPTKIGFSISKEFLNFQNIEKYSIIEIRDPKDQSIGESIEYGQPYYISSSKPNLTIGLEMLLEAVFKVYVKEKPGELIDKYLLPSDFIRSLRNFTSIKNARISSNYNLEITDDILSIENLKFEFLVNDQWFTWNNLSDGTKRLFYIITEVTFANNVILLEEPELGIHPHQLIRLMDFIKEQSEAKQIIITTHSPEVLNTLKMDELDRIIIARYDKEKGTQMSHLSEDDIKHARSYMKDELFLSDYWVMSGFETEEESV